MSSPAADIAEYLEASSDVYRGWMRIRGRRLPVATLGFQHVDEGTSPEGLAEDWDLSPAEVHAALWYFFAHREEIERQVEEEDAEVAPLIAESKRSLAV